MKQRILVISEFFSRGGLETQVVGQARVLSRLGVDIVLATGSSAEECPKDVFSAILPNLKMGAEATFSDLHSTLSKISDFIVAERVTVIHAHPFYSALVGLFAAQQAQLPFLLTLHSPLSVKGIFGPLAELVLSAVVLPTAGRVYCVSPETQLLATAAGNCTTKLLPNSVTISTSPPPPRPKDGPWLWAGRLDEMKVAGLKQLIDAIAEFGGHELHVYGDGPQADALQSYLLNSPDKASFVKLKGWVKELSSVIPDYALVSGMGRVLLEGAAAARPCLLIGYDGIKGLLDANSFEVASYWNLSGRGLENISAAALRKQVEALSTNESLYDVRDWVVRNRDEQVIWRNYLNDLRDLPPTNNRVIQAVFEAIRFRGRAQVPVWSDIELLEIISGLLINLPSIEPEARARAHAVQVTHLRTELSSMRDTLTTLHSDLQASQRSLLEMEAMRDAAVAETALLRSKYVELHESAAREQAARNFWEFRARALENSTSWKLSAPIRIASQAARLAMDAQGRAARIRHLRELTRTSGLPGMLAWVIQRLSRGRRSDNSFNYITPNLTDVSLEAQLATKLPTTLHSHTVLIFAIVPYDDVGGGQRSAQLARILTTSGFRVIYLYAYQKFDFDTQQHVESQIHVPRLEHLFLDETTPEAVFASLADSTNATAIFEAPVDRFLPYLQAARNAGIRTVFELIDAWDTSLGGDWFKQEIFQEFVNNSDRVIGTARELVRTLVKMGREDAQYLPNAVNDRIFDHYKSFPVPPECNTSRRRLLYYGSLYGEWFGWDYIRTAATQNPELDILLIGDYPNNLDLPGNVKLLGARRIDELPAYLQHCDAALLPFIPGKISDAVSPIKIFEYLAMGCLVIATPLPEIKDYPNVVFGETPQEFARLCGTVFEERQPFEHFVMEHSWAARAEEILDLNYQREISAIVLIHNNAKIIDRCLASLKYHGRRYLKEIIVVDNCSTDNGAELVKLNHPDVILLTNPENGCSSGRNLGAHAATGKVLAFFDSDQWLTSGLCFAEASAILATNPKIGAVSWGAGWFNLHKDEFAGPIVDYLEERGTRSPQYVASGYRTDVHYLATSGLFMSRELFLSLDGFDTFYDPTCFEDTDLSFQIRRAGLDIAYRDLTGIRHQPHQTTRANQRSEAYQQLFNRNAAYFGEKWHGLLADIRKRSF